MISKQGYGGCAPTVCRTWQLSKIQKPSAFSYGGCAPTLCRTRQLSKIQKPWRIYICLFYQNICITDSYKCVLVTILLLKKPIFVRSAAAYSMIYIVVSECQFPHLWMPDMAICIMFMYVGHGNSLVRRHVLHIIGIQSRLKGSIHYWERMFMF